MAKVTEQDVVNFLKEKVSQLTKELEAAQNALNALQGSVIVESPVKRGRKSRNEGIAPAAKRKMTSKGSGAKRGRKPKMKDSAVETEVSIAQDQE